MSTSIKKVYINDKAIFPFNNTDEILRFIENQKKILIAMNTEKILSTNEELRSIINKNIGYPDGIGAVMALRRKGIYACKIPGARLWLDIIGKFHREKCFYLIGSTDSVMECTISKLKSEFSQIKIVGFRNGYFSNNDLDEIVKDLKRTKPDIVFVAMGSPKQEYIMSHFISKYPALYMGLGGSFDLYTGATDPVPDWWKRFFKWEGLYRCFYDFKNINRWKRQLPALKIIPKIIFNKL